MRDIDFFNGFYPVKSELTNESYPFTYRNRLQIVWHISIVRLIRARTEYIAEPRNFVIFKRCTDKGQSYLNKIVAVGKRAQTYYKLFAVGIGNNNLCQLRATKSVLT